jgi:hypothetical protein
MESVIEGGDMRSPRFELDVPPGEDLGKLVVAEYPRRMVDGTTEAEYPVPGVGRRSGRVDFLIDVDDSGRPLLAVVEVKNTDWDARADDRIRPNLSRHARQVWNYLQGLMPRVDAGELAGLRAVLLYPRRPSDPGRAELIEETLDSQGISVVFYDDLVPSPFDESARFISWMRTHSLSPERTAVRQDAEASARKLLDARAGRMNVKEGYELARLLNTDWKNGKVTHQRFAPAFQGASYKAVMSNLDAFNRYVGRLWRQREDGALRTLDAIVTKRVSFRGAGRSLPSVLLYLRNPTKYAVWIDATVAGLNALTGVQHRISARSANDYLTFSRDVAELREAHKLAPQEMDVVLTAAGQAARPEVYEMRPSETFTGTLRCFIASALETNTASLRNALTLRDVGWIDAVSVPPYASLLETVTRAVESSDLVCAVLDSSQDQTEVLLAAGIAVAKRVPTYLFVDPAIRPSKILRDFPYALIELDNIEALNLHLDLFLSQVKPRAVRREVDEDNLDALRYLRSPDILEEVESAKPVQASYRGGLEFKRAVLEAFEGAGYLVSAGPSSESADMAVWIDELDSSVGNPILVQTKIRAPTRRTHRKTEQKLSGRVAETRSGAGILVYQDESSRELPRMESQLPLVLSLSFSELTALLESGNLANAIRDARSRVVHGMA